MKNKKSQSVVFDLFIALFVFVLITSIILVMWNKYSLEMEDKIIQKDMWLKTYHITSLLVESKGNPINWHTNYSNIGSFGLADIDRQLNSSKLFAFLNLSENNYSLVRNLLNIEGYEFYFKLSDTGGLIAHQGVSPLFFGVGIDVPGRTTTLRRYMYSDALCETICMCRERQCILEFSLWKMQ